MIYLAALLLGFLLGRYTKPDPNPMRMVCLTCHRLVKDKPILGTFHICT